MAIAHVCDNCGWDLARVRSRREQRYGLNLVTCPKCACHTVRRVHPIWLGWRRGGRASRALLVLAARLLITLTLTALNLFAAFMLLAAWSDIRHEHAVPVGLGAFIVLMLGLLALLTGVWLTAGFEHLPRWKVWMGWLAWVTLVLLVVSAHGPLGDDIDPRGWSGHPGSVALWLRDGVLWIVLPGSMAIVMLLLAALPGIAIGHGLLWLTRVARRARWRAGYRRAHLAKNISWE